MENSKIIELLNQVISRLDILINQQNDSGLLSMNRIARNREESLEKYRRDYERQNAHPSSPVAPMDVYATAYDGHVCSAECEEQDCEDEID